jgi:hypothetical protein
MEDLTAQYSQDLEVSQTINFKDDNLSCLTSQVSLIVKEGWLLKKSSSMFVGFQRVFFSLKDKKLYYYRKASTRKYSGVINFDLVSVKLNSFNLLMELRPLDSKRRFVLAAKNFEELQEWMEALTQHILHSDGHELNLPAPTASKEWWRLDRITSRQFAKTAMTGDVILFSNQTTASRFTRIFTNSEYDHVAMVLRFGSGRVALLEAVFPYVESI